MKFGADVRKDADELYAKLDEDVLKQRVELEKVLTSLKEGDIRRGQVVFHSREDGLRLVSRHRLSRRQHRPRF